MNTATETVRIQGMICRQCEDVVTSSLLHTRGVLNAKASYWKGTVTVDYDPEIVSTSELNKRLENIGYPVGSRGVSGIVVDIICLVGVVLALWLIQMVKSTMVPKAGEGTTLGYIFVIGLMTSTHCLGMCGGILLSQTTDASALTDITIKRSKRGLLSSLSYNGGRVFSYTAVGAIWGALGAVLNYTPTVKSIVFTIAGALVAIIGIQMSGIIPGFLRLSPDLPSFCQLPNGTKKRYYGKPLIIGILTGIMPCMALQAMWMYSMSTGSAGKGALSMLVFSLGTVPLMFIFGALNSFVPRKYIKYMLKISAVLVIALGISMLMSGIKLM